MAPGPSKKNSLIICGVVLVAAIAALYANAQTACQQTVSSASANLNQANTKYCLTANVGGSGTINITANNITLDGQGFRFTGSASIQAIGRTGTIIQNVDVGGSDITIEGGSNNQILDSIAGYVEARETSGAIIRGNTITNTGSTALLIGDNFDVANPSVWSDNNLIENNTITGNGNTDTRFVYMRHMRNSTFRNNTITLLNATFSVSGGEPVDNSTLAVMYTSYNNTLSGNTFTLDIAASHEIYRDQQYVGGALLIRSASSNNIVENNAFSSDAGRGVSIQSSGGFAHPENNTIRGNTIIEQSKALWVQAVREGSQNNLFERNIIVAIDGQAIDASGVQANARATFDHNTVVTKNGDGVWGDGTDTSRQIVFTNNIFSVTNGYTIRLENVSLTMNYNNLYRTNAGNLVWYNGLTYGGLTQWRATGRDLNSISSNPLFVDAVAHDYHLLAGSPSLTADDSGAQQGAYTSIPLTSCQAITTSGSYRLENDVAGGYDCFTIRGSISNITFDGNGHTITTSDRAFDIADLGGGPPSNIEVSNFTTTSEVRIYGDLTNHVTVRQATVGGIAVNGADDVTIDDNVVGSGGVQVNNSDNPWPPLRPIITNNTITGLAGHTSKALIEIAGGPTHPCPRIDGTVNGNTVNNYRNDYPQPEATAVIRIRCATHNTVQNNLFRSHGSTMGLYIRDESDDGLYENNVFWTTLYPALWIASGNNDKTFPSRNVFHNNTFRTDDEYAFYGSAVGTGNVFTYNTFSANSGLLGYVGGYYGNTYDHNTFYNVGSGQLQSLQGNNLDGPPADTYTNNIFSYSGTNIFGYDQWRASRYTGDHNLFHNRSGALAFGFMGNLTSWRSGTGDDTNSINADPLLTNPSAGDFTLASNSPARGAGTGGSDIGAIPFGATPPPLCTESWTCGGWSACSGGTQTRTCTDANACGTTTSRPVLSQSCVMPPDTTPPATISNLQAV